MRFIALDLEINQDENQDIIEVGWCRGDLTCLDISAPHSVLIKPRSPIIPEIELLTGITNAEVEANGSSLYFAYETLKVEHSTFDVFCNLVVWGGDDARFMKQKLVEQGVDLTGWPFGHRVIDVKTLFQAYCFKNSLRPRSGLAKASNRCGLPFIGKKHRAGDDAYNTMRLFFHLVRNLTSGAIHK